MDWEKHFRETSVGSNFGTRHRPAPKPPAVVPTGHPSRVHFHHSIPAVTVPIVTKTVTPVTPVTPVIASKAFVPGMGRKIRAQTAALKAAQASQKAATTTPPDTSSGGSGSGGGSPASAAAPEASAAMPEPPPTYQQADLAPDMLSTPVIVPAAVTTETQKADLITGVPNWALATGVGAAVIMLFRVKK